MGSRLKTVLVSFAIALIALLFQHSSSIIAQFAGSSFDLHRLDSHSWDGETSVPWPGTFYVSFGRPRGLCDFYLDGKIVATTKGAEPGLRGQLLLGAVHETSSLNQRVKLKIVCLEEGGFGPSIMHGAILAPHRIGTAIQVWRGFNELVLGPASSFAFLIYLLLRRSENRPTPSPRSRLLFAFALCSVMYSISLSYYTRLFVNGGVATSLHVVLKGFWSISFLAYCGTFTSKRRLPVLLSSTVPIGGLFVAWFSPELIERFYDRVYVLVPISTLIVTIDLFAREPKSEAAITLRLLLAVTLISQVLDCMIVLLNTGVYATPVVLSVIAALTAIVNSRAEAQTIRLHRAVSEIAEILRRDCPLPQAVGQVALIMHMQTKFSRLSVYLDSYCLGTDSRPGQNFVRILESGYRKSTAEDSSISVREGRGLKMYEAITERKPLLRRSISDKASFINVPIGPHVCLNLSDDGYKPDYVAEQSFAVVEELHAVLGGLADRFVEYGARTNVALERLRSEKGDGIWPVDMAAIFVDVCDFSHLTEQFGQPFAEFVSGTYLPALCRYVCDWAVREYSRGDEVYLVCLSGVTPGSSEVLTSCISCLGLLEEFADRVGSTLCHGSGFPTLQLSIGANIGKASLICDSFQVRTTGDMVNEASRLKDAAGKGEILVHKNLADLFPEEHRARLGKRVPILVKRTLVEAHTYLPISHAA